MSARCLAGTVGLAAVAVGLLASELTVLLGLLGLAVGLAVTAAIPVVVTTAPALHAVLVLRLHPLESGPLAGDGLVVVLGLPLGVLAFLLGRAAG